MKFDIRYRDFRFTLARAGKIQFHERDGKRGMMLFVTRQSAESVAKTINLSLARDVATVREYSRGLRKSEFDRQLQETKKHGANGFWFHPADAREGELHFFPFHKNLHI